MKNSIKHRSTISFDEDVWKIIQESRSYDMLNYDLNPSVSEKVNELIRSLRRNKNGRKN